MNRSKLIALFVLLATAFTSNGQKAHPYLFYTHQRVQQLKERVKKDTAMNRAWSVMKMNADNIIGSVRSGNIEEMALVYRVTGDTKYAAAAKKGLVQLLSKPAWDGLDDRTPKWNSGLNTARSNYVAAVVFDAIYDYLSGEERKKMAQDIVRLGIKPSIGDWISFDNRLHTLNSMGHNWWSSLVFQAGTASLAVMNEVPEAKKWVNDVMEASKEWFAFAGSVLENKPVNFDRNGGFYESVNYANFGIGEYLLYRLAYTNALGSVKMPYDNMLEKTMDWFINASYPTNEALMSVNFGDGNVFANADRPVKLMIALGHAKERYFWYLNQTSMKQIREDLHINTPLGLLYNPEQKETPAVPDLPTAALYPDMGWAMLRSSWQNNATMLGVKCGYTWNHSHADAGSFILFHKGKNLLIDAGNVNYGLPEYSSYFVRSEAHNVILFNGKAQEPQDQYNAVKTPGHVYNLIDGGGLKYVMADATGPTAHYFLRNYRNFLWVGNVILIIDDVKTYDSGKFEWLLHFNKVAKRTGIDIEVSDDSAQVLVRPLFPETLPNGYPQDFPEKMRLEERTAMKDHDAKTKITYYALSPAEPTRQTKFITAIIIPDENTHQPISIPKIEKLQTTDMVGVRITQQGEVTDVYFNLLADGRLMHRNSHGVFNGWETDAYIFSVSYPIGSDAADLKNITRYFVSNGSYIRRDGKVILHSLSKVFMDAELKDGQPAIIMQGQPLINAWLRMEHQPKELLLNNERMKPFYGPDKFVRVQIGR